MCVDVSLLGFRGGCGGGQPEPAVVTLTLSCVGRWKAKPRAWIHLEKPQLDAKISFLRAAGLVGCSAGRGCPGTHPGAHLGQGGMRSYFPTAPWYFTDRLGRRDPEFKGKELAIALLPSRGETATGEEIPASLTLLMGNNTGLGLQEDAELAGGR